MGMQVLSSRSHAPAPLTKIAICSSIAARSWLSGTALLTSPVSTCANGGAATSRPVRRFHAASQPSIRQATADSADSDSIRESVRGSSKMIT